MIENLCTNKIKLFSDIKDYTERKKLIEKEVLFINIPFEAHCINTLHYLIYDGLSQSESSLLELLYKHNPYPCALVGGVGLAETWTLAEHLYFITEKY